MTSIRFWGKLVSVEYGEYWWRVDAQFAAAGTVSCFYYAHDITRGATAVDRRGGLGDALLRSVLNARQRAEGAARGWRSLLLTPLPATSQRAPARSRARGVPHPNADGHDSADMASWLARPRGRPADTVQPDVRTRGRDWRYGSRAERRNQYSR